MKLIVSCNAVKLKLTLTEKQLERSLLAAVVEPFLGAYNKRAPTPLATDRLEGVAIDGVDVDPSRTASELLPSSSDLPTVVLHAPPLEGAAALVEALASLPADAPVEDAAAALLAVRRASREADAREAVLAPGAVASAAEHACLAAGSSRELDSWGDAAAEALALLNNLLVLDPAGVAAALCSPPIDALPKLVATLERASSIDAPPPRVLQFAGPVAFHISCHGGALGAHAAALLRACSSAVGAASGRLGAPAPPADDEAPCARLASGGARALFNLLRLAPPWGQQAAAEGGEEGGEEGGGEEGGGESAVAKTLTSELVGAVVGLLEAPGRSPELHDARLASLQLCVALPARHVHPLLVARGAWRPIAATLRPAFEAVEAEGVACNEPLVPCVVLQRLCAADDAARAALKLHLFEDVIDDEADADDPYRPVGEAKGYDPTRPIAPAAPVRCHVVKALTSSNYSLKTAVGNFVYALCDAGEGDGKAAEEVVRLCGLGSSAGLLQERNLFAAFQHLAT